MMMNGVVILGSHDGMNELVCKAVGQENFVMFGSTESDIDRLNAGLGQRKRPEPGCNLLRAIEAIKDGAFGTGFNA